MPQVSISNALAWKTILDSFVYQNAGSWGSSTYRTFNFDGNANNRIRISLMQGAVPTDFSALTNYTTSRSSDRLVDWYPKNQGTWNNDGVKTWWWTTSELEYAQASGTTTWLWWCAGQWDSNSTINHQAVFSVGTLGSGSDFELINTSIVNGIGYKLVNGPRITMNTEFNY